MVEPRSSCTPLSYIERMNDHYSPLVGRHGHSYRSNDWGSGKSQLRRFDVLLGCAEYHNLRILDVGCGTGNMASYLRTMNFTGQYLGVDIVPDMIAQARLNVPEYNFRVISSFSQASSFNPDFILASGIFTFADQNIFFDSIKELFQISSRIFAFNALSSWKADPEQGEFHADPASTLDFCSSLTRKITLIHDYMPHDFTVAMYK